MEKMIPFDAPDKVTNQPVIDKAQEQIAEKTLMEFRDKLHDKIGHLVTGQFNELQILLRDNLPREHLSLNMFNATWRAIMIDFIDYAIRAGDYCEREHVRHIEEVAKERRKRKQ